MENVGQRFVNYVPEQVSVAYMQKPQNLVGPTDSVRGVETCIDGADVGPRDPGRGQPDEFAIVEIYGSPPSKP
jgi:hypothetical protein